MKQTMMLFLNIFLVIMMTQSTNAASHEEVDREFITGLTTVAEDLISRNLDGVPTGISTRDLLTLSETIVSESEAIKSNDKTGAEAALVIIDSVMNFENLECRKLVTAIAKYYEAMTTIEYTEMRAQHAKIETVICATEAIGHEASDACYAAYNELHAFEHELSQALMNRKFSIIRTPGSMVTTYDNLVKIQLTDSAIGIIPRIPAPQSEHGRTMIMTGFYGERRDGHIHAGIDIQRGGGLPIQAVFAGEATCKTTKKGTSYGNHVVIQHKHLQLETLYAHGRSHTLSSPIEEVTEGQIILLEGATGRIKKRPGGTGIHLHLEVAFIDQTGMRHRFNPLLLFEGKDISGNIVEFLYLAKDDRGRYSVISEEKFLELRERQMHLAGAQ